jgi:hypothetical protein
LTLLLSAPFGVGQDGNTGKEKYSTRAVEVSKADKGTATKESTTASDQFEYTTSWIGNTFGGNDPNPPNQTLYHVTLDMNSIYVTPDGKVFTNTGWDEGGRPVSVFEDGRIISSLNDQNNSPNWRAGGGGAVAADDKYIYAAQATGPRPAGDPNPLDGGQGVFIFNQSDMTNSNLLFTGSTTLYNEMTIYGMALAKGKLYVTENDVNLVEVFDTTSRALVASYSIQNPVRIALDREGGMWISHEDQTPLPTTPAGNVYDINGQMGLPAIDHYSADGRLINTISLPEGGQVGALWIDQWGHLLVGDDGPDQNIKIYGNILQKPELIATFGEKGGNYAGPVPGRVGPKRFRGITGIGTDARGNLYVSESGFGLDKGVGHGVVLESYSPWGDLNWSVEGLEFVSMGSADPRSDTDVYDAYHHFKMDYSAAPGHEATYVADTYNRFKYPDDVRVTSIASTGKIVHIHGKKFLLVGNQGGTLMEMYRFEDANEIAIPCVAFDYGSFQAGNYQDFVVQPIDGEFIWRDLNGNGRMDSNEFIEPPNNAHRDGGYFFVDTNGDVWQVNYQAEFPPYESSIHLRRYFFQGFDQYGAPIYDYTHMKIYDALVDLPDMNQIAGAIFKPDFSDGGTLFVAGGTTSQGSFSQVVRYDNWDKGNRKATWITNIPYDPDPNNTWAPNSFTVAGDFFFVDFWEPHYNLVFSAETGTYVGRFVPQQDVGGVNNVGNTDEWQANQAVRRPNGEYLLFQEEDYQSKILMYRWTPPNQLPTPPVPQAPTALTGTPDDETASLTWTGGPDALIYNVGRASQSGGPYTPVQTGVYQTSVFDQGLADGKTYYYVVSAEADTGLTSSNSPEIAVTPKPAGTTYEAENGIFTPPAFVVSCSECSGGARVGAFVQGVTITFSNVVVPTTGNYAVRIYVVNGNQPSDWGLPQEPSLDVIPNGGNSISSGPLPFTGDWNTPGYTTVNVPLNAGTNTIVLSAPISEPDVDRIVVAFQPN